MSSVKRLTDAEYGALKKTLNLEHLAILEKAEKDCVDMSLNHLEVYCRSFQWQLGRRWTPETIGECRNLKVLVWEVWLRARELRGTTVPK